jgi:hypothetical protein
LYGFELGAGPPVEMWMKSSFEAMMFCN